MQDFILQDLVTIRGRYNVTVTQSADDWFDLEDYDDVFFWLDIREVTFATSMTQITFGVQTAPIRDELLFMNMGSGGYAVGSATPPSAPVILSYLDTSALVPLGRFVRWQLVPIGGTAGTWDLCFRLIGCANYRGGSGGHRMVPGRPMGGQ